MMKKLLDKYNGLSVQLRASVWFLFCTAMQKGVSVIMTPIFTRIMTKAQYGKYGVFNSWFGIISVLVTLRLYYGVYSQGLVKFEDIRAKFSSALQGLSLTLTGIWFAIYLIGYRFWNGLLNLSFPAMIAMFITIWTTAIFGFWAANERVEFQYRKLVIVTIIVSLAKPLLGVLLVLNMEEQALGRVWAVAIVELVVYFWMFVKQMREGRCFFSKDIWKYALRFNIPLIPHYLSQTVLNSSDRIMIEKYVDSDSAGVYTLAYSISTLMLLFVEALHQTLSPWVYKKIKTKDFSQINGVIYICMMLIAGVNLMLIIVAPEVLRIFAEPEYYEAIWIIAPIALSTFYVFLYNVFSYFEFYHEKTKVIAASTAVAAILNVVLNYIFIRRYGYYAAAYTTLFCYAVYALLHYFVMRRICKQSYPEEKIFSPAIILAIAGAFMVIGFLLMRLYSFIVLRYVIVLIAMIICVIFRNKLIGFIKMLRSK